MANQSKKSDRDEPKLSELITLKDAAELCGLSTPHLRLLVRSGKVWGQRIGHNWLTTAQAVKEYLAREHRPGPKPKSDH